MFFVPLVSYSQNEIELDGPEFDDIGTIIGGDPIVSTLEYPSVVQIQIYRPESVATCTGVILNNSYVLTAGHCVAKAQNIYIRIRAGFYDEDNIDPFIMQEREADLISFHPSSDYNSYNSNTINYEIEKYDLALIKVNLPFVYSNQVNKIDLPVSGNFIELNGTNNRLNISDFDVDVNFLNNPTNLDIVGWGQTQTGNSATTVLQKLENVRDVDRNMYIATNIIDCSGFLGYNDVWPDTYTIAKVKQNDNLVPYDNACENLLNNYKWQDGPSSGDSGGPLIYTDLGIKTLIGIFSAFKSPNLNRNGSYVNLQRDEILNWIDCVINSNTTSCDAVATSINEDDYEPFQNFVGDFDISTDVTWDKDTKLDGLINITNGATLRIKNCKVRCAFHSDFKVQQGSNLVLDNAHITAYTSDFDHNDDFDDFDGRNWTGIELVGKNTVEHIPNSLNDNYDLYGQTILDIKNNLEEINPTNNTVPNQPVVFLKNNSIISHAGSAIYNTDDVDSDTGETTGGGIVFAENSLFWNNACGVVLRNYSDHFNISTLKNTAFKIDDRFRNDIWQIGAFTYSPIAQIMLKNNSHLNISGVIGADKNIFSVSNSYISAFIDNFSKTGRAIKSWGSKFRVENYNFFNFEIGIEAVNGTTTILADYDLPNSLGNENVEATGVTLDNKIRVIGSTFFNHKIAIFLSAINKVLINENLFNTQFNNALGDYKNAALYLESCVDLQVANNAFYGVGEETNAIVINGTTDGDNKIVKNLFGVGTYDIKMKTAIHAFADNDMLQISCNNFGSRIGTKTDENGNYYDNYAIYADGLTTIGQPLPSSMGACGTPAIITSPLLNEIPTGNLFEDNTSENIIYNNAIPVEYNFYEDNNINPSFYSPAVFYTGTNGTWILNSCDNQSISNNYCGDFDYSTELINPNNPNINYFTALNNILTFENMIAVNINLTTKFDRNDIFYSIEGVTNINSLESLIEDFEVYMSDNELIATLDQIDAFDIDRIISILEDNAPLNLSVLTALSNKLDNLSFEKQLEALQYENRILSLQNQENQQSLRNELNAETAYFINSQYRYVSNLTKYWMSNGQINNSIALLEHLVDNTGRNKLKFKKLLFEYKLKNNQIVEAESTLSTNVALDETELEDYFSVAQMEIDRMLENRHVNHLTAAEIDNLNLIAQNSTKGGILAKNLLASYNNTLENPVLPNVKLKPQERKKQLFTIFNKLKNLVEIYPNPATEFVNIKWDNTVIKNEILYIKLISAEGKLVLNKTVDNLGTFKLNLSHLQKGIYKLVFDNTITKSIVVN